MIGISRTKLYDLIKSGRIIVLRLDGTRFVDMQSVSELFAKCPQVSPAAYNTVTLEQLGLPDLPDEAEVADPEMHELQINFTALFGSEGRQ